MAFTTVTITCDYDLADGTDPVGTVSFTPTAPMVNGTTVVAARVTERLNVDGLLTVNLAANTDPATAPTGTAYLVEESIGTAGREATRSYYVEIPHDQGAALDLSYLASAGVAPAISFPAGMTLAAGDARYAPLAAVSISPSGGDDTTAISNAMDTANSTGRALFFLPGTYTCGTITKTYAPRVTAAPGSVTIQASNTSSWTWNFTGSLGSTVALSANAARNVYTLTVASTSGLAAGDLILIGDDQASYATQSTRKHGQLAQISSIDSGTTLTLTEATYTSFATASSAFIAKVTAPDRALVTGLRFLNTNASSTGGFLRFTYCRDVEVDMVGEGSAAAGVRLSHCYGFRVRAAARNYYDNGTTQFGYAVEAAGATCHGQIAVDATRVRHAFTCGGIDSEYGEPSDIRVTGVAHGCTAQSWDAHAQGSDITFVDCQSFGAKSYGFALRGKRQHVQGGVVQGGYGGVWLFEQPVDNRIAGLRVADVAASDALDSSGAGGRGVRVAVATSGLTVTDCEIINVARDGVLLESASSDITIRDNVLRNVGQATVSGHRSAIHANAALTRARIQSNIITDNQGSITTTAGITLDAASTDVALRDNDVQAGISILTGTGATSAVTRTTAVDRLTTWQPSSAIATNTGRMTTLASAGVLTSGTLTLAGGLVLPANQTVSSITFVSAGTAAVTPTNQWFCLVDQSLNVLAKTNDNTTTAWGANIARTLTISGGYTPVVDTPVYAGVMVVAGTVPTLQTIGVASVLIGLTPVLAGTSTTGLTNPASLGSTAASLTALANLPYAHVS